MTMSKKLCVLTAFLLGASVHAADKTLIDYFLPMPIQGRLVSDVWGAPGVFPRDPKNGLEDETMKQWCYWDGQIIKGPDGKMQENRIYLKALYSTIEECKASLAAAISLILDDRREDAMRGLPDDAIREVVALK